MGNVMTVPCRSYSAQAFDGCPACVDAALEAVTQAGLYLLGRTAPGLVRQADGPVEMAYRIKVRLRDEDGAEMASDEMEAEQTIEAVPPSEGEPEFAVETVGREDEGESRGGEPETTMRLDDFQTVLECVELAPGGPGGVSGVIAGNLFGYERLVGSFTIEVAPGR